MGGKSKNKNKKASKKAKNKKRASKRQNGSGKGKNKQLWENHWNLFQAEMKEIGLQIRDIEGDGNCLFRAIADQMEGDESKHQIYRAICCNYLMENEDYFGPFVLDDQTYESYVEGMRKNGIWGGNLELQALSKALQVNFILHMQGKDPLIIKNNHYNVKTPPVLHLAYHVVKDMGEHYSSVRMIGDDSKEAALPIELEMFKDLQFVEGDDLAFLLDQGSDAEGNNSEDDDEMIMDQIKNNKINMSANPPAPFKRPLNPKQIDKNRWVSHLQAFQEYASKIKVCSKDNGDDNLALYGVVADQVFGHNESKEELLDLVINFAENNEEYVSKLLIEGSDYNSYLKKLKTRSTWGGLLELQILSKCLQLNLIIMEKGKKPYKIINEHATPERPFIMIGYHVLEGIGENFTSIRRPENLEGPQDLITYEKGKAMPLVETDGEKWIKENNLKELEERKKKEEIKESIRNHNKEIYEENWHYKGEEEEEKKMDEISEEEELRMQIAQIELNEKEEKLDRLKNFDKEKNCFCGKKKKYKNCCYEKDLEFSNKAQAQDTQPAPKKKLILI